MGRGAEAALLFHETLRDVGVAGGGEVEPNSARSEGRRARNQGGCTRCRSSPLAMSLLVVGGRRSVVGGRAGGATKRLPKIIMPVRRRDKHKLPVRISQHRRQNLPHNPLIHKRRLIHDY